MKFVDIKKLFELKQNEMLASFNLNQGFNHPTAIGDATEEEWRKWFEKFFPKRYKTEKAFIIDHRGNCSEQMDVVIYDTHFSPTIFESNGEKYIPAESVYAVFEVKQDLNREHIVYAINKIKSVKSLIRTSAPINTISGYKPGRITSIIGGLLTFKTKWEDVNIEKNLFNAIIENTKNKNEEIDFVCCLSKCAYAVNNQSAISHIDKKELYIPNINLVTDKNSSPLIFTYFKLLRMLQDLGNVPAIEFDKYGIFGIDHKMI